MRILLNDNNEIVGYATIGGLEGDFEVSDNIVPNGFKEDFEPRRFSYNNGVISYNKNNDSITPIQPIPGIEQRVSELEKQMKAVQNYIDNKPQA